MTLQEIADTATTSLSTVASRYRYALDKLRAAFDLQDAGKGNQQT